MVRMNHPLYYSTTIAGTSSRSLHLAPSRLSNDSFFVPLLRQAASWEYGSRLCLHLQPYPVPWIFYTDDGGDEHPARHEGPDLASLSNNTSLAISDRVLKELLILLKGLPAQNRKLHLILKKDFIADDTKLLRILEAAAPAMIRLESDHPLILDHTPWSKATFLKQLAVEISQPGQLDLLYHALLECGGVGLRTIHLHFARRWSRSTAFEYLAPKLARISNNILHPSSSIRSLKLSGSLQYAVPLLGNDEYSNPAPVQVTNLQKLELESSFTFLTFTDEEDGEVANSHLDDELLLSSKSLQQIGKRMALLHHLTIRLRHVACKIPSLEGSPTEFFRSLVHPSTSLTHLTIQAGLTTPMVDQLLVHVHDVAPNLREIDLEGNDMESLELVEFRTRLTLVKDPRRSFVPWRRLYLGCNLFSQTSPQTKQEVETLLQLCPRLDIGHRGMQSCGATFLDDPLDEVGGSFGIPNEENGMDCGGFLPPPVLFTSWAHGSAPALAWKDWNQAGRYLIWMSSEECPQGLWPLVLEHAQQRFRHQPQRQATVLFRFLQSGAIPLKAANAAPI